MNPWLILLGAYLFIKNQAQKAVDQFDYKLTGFTVKTFQGLKLIPKFSIYNSSNLPVKINSAGLMVQVNGNTIARFTGPVNITLQPNQYTPVSLSFTASGLGASTAIYSLIKNEGAPAAQLVGSISTSLGTYPVKVATND